jgi:hypothetical protein
LQFVSALNYLGSSTEGETQQTLGMDAECQRGLKEKLAFANLPNWRIELYDSAQIVQEKL